VADEQQASPLILLAIYGRVKFSFEDKTHSLRRIHIKHTMV